MEKVNNSFCNVNSFHYDEKKKELTVNYKLVGEKVYQDFSKESYLKLVELNEKNKTIGACLWRETKKKI